MQSRTSDRLIWVSIGFCLTVAAFCVPWDIEISRRIRGLKIPGDIHRFIELSEAFAYSATCGFLFCCLAWCDLERRRLVLSGWLYVIVGGGIVDALKVAFPKLRPNAFDSLPLEMRPNSSWELWKQPFSCSWFDTAHQSFPSGHSATAVCAAIALTYLYPRGKWFYGVIAALSCFQRVEGGAHYPSDVLASVAFALLLGRIFLAIMNRYVSKNCGEVLKP